MSARRAESGPDRAPSAQRARGTGGVRVQGLSHTFRTRAGEEVAALSEVDLAIDPGQIVCVLGPSGCGKSTLLRIIAGFLPPTRGQVFADGRPVTRPDASRGVVFQRADLFPWLSVQGNVEVGPRLRKMPAPQRHAIAQEHLELVGLSGFARARPYELSGGMQQRCQIARVLAAGPRTVLMDEPFGALDDLTRARLQEDLLRIHRERRTTILFITHSVDEAVYLGDRVVVMSARPGRIHLEVPTELTDQDRAGGAEAVRGSTEFLEVRRTVAEAVASTGA